MKESDKAPCSMVCSMEETGVYVTWKMNQKVSLFGSYTYIGTNHFLCAGNEETRVVTHGQQQYVVTYYMHKTTPANVYT